MLANTDTAYCDPLLAIALTPDNPVTRTFVSAINMVRSSTRLAGRRTFGLDSNAYKRLLNAYFPGAGPVYVAQAINAVTAGASSAASDEFDELLALLLKHRADTGVETTWLAYAITACCMGDDHLWQDMGLDNRQQLSDLLQRHFPILFYKNTGNMRWKKFFYKQLCEQTGTFVCRAPSCSVCVDYQSCYGTEEEVLWL